MGGGKAALVSSVRAESSMGENHAVVTGGGNSLGSAGRQTASGESQDVLLTSFEATGLCPRHKSSLTPFRSLAGTRTVAYELQQTIYAARTYKIPSKSSPTC